MLDTSGIVFTIRKITDAIRPNRVIPHSREWKVLKRARLCSLFVLAHKDRVYEDGNDPKFSNVEKYGVLKNLENAVSPLRGGCPCRSVWLKRNRRDGCRQVGIRKIQKVWNVLFVLSNPAHNSGEIVFKAFPVTFFGH